MVSDRSGGITARRIPALGTRPTSCRSGLFGSVPQRRHSGGHLRAQDTHSQCPQNTLRLDAVVVPVGQTPEQNDTRTMAGSPPKSARLARNRVGTHWNL